MNTTEESANLNAEIGDRDKSITLFMQGLSNYKKGDFHKAVPYFQQSINVCDQTHPDRLKYESFYGMTLIKLNYKHIGLEKCRIAAKIDADNSEILLNLAEAEFLTGNRLSSLIALRHLKSVHPGYSDAQALRARMGKRHKFPVIPFLSRDNSLNILLGKWLYSHRVLQP